MRIATIISLLVLLLIASNTDSRACVCVCDGNLTVDRYIADSSVIIVGRVLEIKGKNANPGPSDDVVVISSCGEQSVRVVVNEMLKGTPATEVSFLRSDIGTACDFRFPFRERGVYLLFGLLDNDGSTLYLSGCSPSFPIKSASKTIKRVRRQFGGANQ